MSQAQKHTAKLVEKFALFFQKNSSLEPRRNETKKTVRVIVQSAKTDESLLDSESSPKTRTDDVKKIGNQMKSLDEENEPKEMRNNKSKCKSCKNT